MSVVHAGLSGVKNSRANDVTRRLCRLSCRDRGRPWLEPAGREEAVDWNEARHFKQATISTTSPEPFGRVQSEGWNVDIGGVAEAPTVVLSHEVGRHRQCLTFPRI